MLEWLVIGVRVNELISPQEGSVFFLLVKIQFVALIKLEADCKHKM